MKKYALMAAIALTVACKDNEATPETPATTNVVEKSFGQELKEKVVKQAVDTAVDEVVDKAAEKAKDKAKDKILESLIP